MSALPMAPDRAATRFATRRPLQSSQRAGGGLELFRPASPNVSGDRVLRIQGHSDMARVRPVIRRAAEAMAREAAALSAPLVAWRAVPIVSRSGDAIEIGPGVNLACAAFPRTLAGCTEVAPFVLTVGVGLSARVFELAEAGDLMEAVLLEAAGWLALEDATRQFKTVVRSSALARAHRITSRMGPGYSYRVDGRTSMWPLEQQAELFAALAQGESLPVELAASCAMRPKLSRSGMYGIAPLAEAGAQHQLQSEERFQ